MAMDESTAKD